MGRKCEKCKNLPEDHKKGTFLVKISYDRNETWHGTVTYAEGNVTQRFRSGLELIRLMDDALINENLITEEKVSNG